MNTQRLIDAYFSAWNLRDTDALLALMHSGATIYDAFWRETCVGRDLRQYLQNSFDEDIYWYRQDGDAIETESGVVYRYHAYERADFDGRKVILNGAEVLTLRDGKIITISDIYCDPSPAALIEIARLAAKRHGESRYANAGLGALKSMRFRNRLAVAMNLDQVYLDPALTVQRLADRIGCSVLHLEDVINAMSGMGFSGFVNECRAKYARQLLAGNEGKYDWFDRIAEQSGFPSKHAFSEAFREVYGETPEEFVRHL